MLSQEKASPIQVANVYACKQHPFNPFTYVTNLPLL